MPSSLLPGSRSLGASTQSSPAHFCSSRPLVSQTINTMSESHLASLHVHLITSRNFSCVVFCMSCLFLDFCGHVEESSSPFSSPTSLKTASSCSDVNGLSSASLYTTPETKFVVRVTYSTQLMNRWI